MQLQLKINRKSHSGFQLVRVSIVFNDLNDYIAFCGDRFVAAKKRYPQYQLDISEIVHRYARKFTP